MSERLYFLHHVRSQRRKTGDSRSVACIAGLKKTIPETRSGPIGFKDLKLEIKGCHSFEKPVAQRLNVIFFSQTDGRGMRRKNYYIYLYEELNVVAGNSKQSNQWTRL